MTEPVPTTPTTDDVLEHMRERWRFGITEGDARAYRLHAVDAAVALYRESGASHLTLSLYAEPKVPVQEHLTTAADLVLRVADRFASYALTGVDPAAPEGTDA